MSRRESLSEESQSNSLEGEAVLQGELPRIFAVLRQGLATPEHAAFVEELAKR